MAQSLVKKRQNIATRAIEAATKLVDAIHDLDDLREERAVAGNFLQTDFDGTDLVHLSDAMIGSLLDTDVPAIVAFYGADAGRKDRLNGVRR